MDVKLSDDNMKDIIAKAVLDTLTPESREGLIKSALKDLLTVAPNSGYGARKSPLQEAFDSAVRDVAFQIARDQIKGNGEVAEQIKELIAEAWGKLINDENRSTLVEKLAGALEKGLTGDRY